MTQNLSKINTVIVEDDPIFCYALQKMLGANFPTIQIASIATTAEEAKQAIKKHRPDLILLDVLLPNNKNAFELLEGIHNRSTQIIFMTASPQEEVPLALSKYSVIDYLSKPIDNQVFKAAVDRGIARCVDEQALLYYKKKLLQEEVVTIKKDSENVITLKLTKGRFVKVQLDQVLRCESNGDLTNLYFADPKKEKLVLLKSLKECEQTFRPDLFCRTHKQHLVNLKFVNKIHVRSALELELMNGKKIPIARRRKKEVLKRYCQNSR